MILEVKIIRVSSYDILLCTADKPRSTLTGSMERRIAFAERGTVATQLLFTFYPPIVRSFLQRSSTWRITVSNVPDRSSSIGRIFSHLSLSVSGNAWSWQVYRRKCSWSSWFVRLSSAHTHIHGNGGAEQKTCPCSRRLPGIESRIPTPNTRATAARLSIL